MNTLENKWVEKYLDFEETSNLGLPPSLELLVHQKGRKKMHIKYGKEFRFYDLASLTKILFTTTMFMNAFEQNKIKSNSKVCDFLPEWPHKRMTINSLLAHYSKLNWWQPYYKDLSKIKDQSKKHDGLKEKLFKEKLKTKYAYSDLDFWTLGFVLEAIYKKNLNDIWETIYSKSHFRNLHFNKENKLNFKKSEYAPTEKCPWRKKTLQGQVHDDNAWAMGGVAPHAGLFGGAEDVSQWGLSLRGSYLNQSKKLVSSRTVKHFFKKQKPGNDWGLGFMLPTKGSASCGKHYSLNSVGHTGFTGTSFWWDPKQDVMITLLTNRVNPTRKNRDFVKLRPIMHNWVMEVLN